ncbi:FadR family transcriptional regulator [Rhodococcoides fascians A21d2]|uniref:FadR/GntR family transcriptional regulator n=1 Tax=Rhodococcoides fascians TaxID=1828 RepID=UPI000562E178|nr:FadR/GntR family transcriptional regulator [Rhodococcus fascians]QII00341.1 FadR family transcriptional regulator [Rhodococcus fascians A21d2]
MIENEAGGLTDRVESELRRCISDEVWPQGSLIPSENELASTHGVSRTVVREAISRLRTAGLVQTRKGRGSVVLAKPPSGDFGRSLESVHNRADRVHLLELRRAVEVEAAALAATRRTDGAVASLDASLDASIAAPVDASDAVAADFAFHRAVALASNNRFLLEVLDSLGAAVITRPYVGEDGQDSAHQRRVLDEHHRIRDAIAAGDPMGAAAAMRTHLDASLVRLERS